MDLRALTEYLKGKYKYTVPGMVRNAMQSMTEPPAPKDEGPYSGLLGGPNATIGPANPPAPEMPVVEPPATPEVPEIPAPAPAAQMPGKTPLPAIPSDPEMPAQSSAYGDDARKALYDALAKKRQQGSIWSAIGALGDGIAQGSGIKSNAQANVEASLKGQDETARDEFEAGLKAETGEQTRDQLIRAYLAQRSDAKWDKDYKNRALQQQEELKRLAVQQALATKTEAKADKADQTRDKYVQRHAEQMQKQGIPELLGAYNRLAASFSTNKGDIPGIGALDGMKPNWLLGDEGLSNQQSLQQIANVILKLRSGAAVSDQEYRRFLLELQAGKIPTEKALRARMKNMGDDLRAVMAQSETALPPDALNEYRSRPGALRPEDVQSTEASGFDDAKKKRLAELRAKKAAGTLR